MDGLTLHGITATDWLGYIAACFTTGAFVPQAWLTFRSRDVGGVSLGMYAAFTCGVALWLLYGLAAKAWPVVIANAITLVLASVILLMKIVFEARRRLG